MARFANACRRATVRLTQDLEVELGPGTADLALRFGLNSGEFIRPFRLRVLHLVH